MSLAGVAVLYREWSAAADDCAAHRLPPSNDTTGHDPGDEDTTEAERPGEGKTER